MLCLLPASLPRSLALHTRPVNGTRVLDLISGSQEKCPLPAGWQTRYPQCEQKMKVVYYLSSVFFLSLARMPNCFQWMSAFWKTDPCYQKYGVDGSNCSIIVYLSEVEHYCPKLPTRPLRNISQTPVLQVWTPVSLSLRSYLSSLVGLIFRPSRTFRSLLSLA